MKWTEVFNDEKELIETFRSINFNRVEFKNETYYRSMQEYLKRAGSLTPKQLTALKRNAEEIKRFSYLDKMFGGKRYQ